MPKKIFFSFIFILILLVLGTFIFLGIKGYSASDLKNALYIGRCTRCGCLYEIPQHQIYQVRQMCQFTCLFCPECRKIK